jgi:hypothetical protein
MFDLISWAIGFGATQSTRALIEKLYPDDLRSRLNDVAENWAGNLPDEIRIDPAQLMEPTGVGPSREKLQIRLFLHNHPPSEALWFFALQEAWNEARANSAYQFFKQSHDEAEIHLRKLAKALAIECTKDRKLFQVSTLHQLEKILSEQTALKRELGITRSQILDSIENIAFRPHLISQKAISQLLEHPHLCHGQGLLDLNSLLLVDSPSSIVSGKIRRSESWVGPAGSIREQASFIPPPPSEVPSLFAEFIGKWSGAPSPLHSRNQGEIYRGIALFHHELLQIHPFEDGNGKVARAISDQQARHLFCVDKRLCLRDSPRYLESLARADSGDIDLLVSIVESAITTCLSL